MPTRGASTSMLLELGLDGGLGGGLGAAGLLAHAASTARSAMSRRSWRPSNVDHVGGSIRGVPGGTRVVARARSR